MGKKEFASLSRLPLGTTPPKIDGATEIQEIQVAGDWAFMWTRLSVVVTPPEGGQPMERAGHTLTVLKRVSGRWKRPAVAEGLGIEPACHGLRLSHAAVLKCHAARP